MSTPLSFGTSANPGVQYGGYNSITSRPRQQPVQGGDMLQLILQMLQAQQQQQSGRAAMQREALNPVRRGMGGGVIDQTTGQEAGNPFNNRFFLNGAQRAQREQDVLQGAPYHPPMAAFGPDKSQVPAPIIPDAYGADGMPMRNTLGQNPYGTGRALQMGAQPQKPKRLGSSFGMQASAGAPRPKYSF